MANPMRRVVLALVGVCIGFLLFGTHLKQSRAGGEGGARGGSVWVGHEARSSGGAAVEVAETPATSVPDTPVPAAPSASPGPPRPCRYLCCRIWDIDYLDMWERTDGTLKDGQISLGKATLRAPLVGYMGGIGALKEASLDVDIRHRPVRSIAIALDHIDTLADNPWHRRATQYGTWLALEILKRRYGIADDVEVTFFFDCTDERMAQRKDAGGEPFAEWPNFGNVECMRGEAGGVLGTPARRSRSGRQDRGPFPSFDAVLTDVQSMGRVLWSMAFMVWDSEECEHRQHASELYQAFLQKLLGGLGDDGRPRLAPPAALDGGEAVGCYIMRNTNDMTEGTRAVANNDAMVDVMRRVLPRVRLVHVDIAWSQLKISEHMYNCSVVLGVHGAGMTNIDYVQPSAAVVELVQTLPLDNPRCADRGFPVCPFPTPTQHYLNFATARGLPLFHVGDPAVDKDVRNYTVPDHVLADIEVALQRAYDTYQRRKADSVTWVPAKLLSPTTERFPVQITPAEPAAHELPALSDPRHRPTGRCTQLCCLMWDVDYLDMWEQTRGILLNDATSTGDAHLKAPVPGYVDFIGALESSSFSVDIRRRPVQSVAIVLQYWDTFEGNPFHRRAVQYGMWLALEVVKRRYGVGDDVDVTIYASCNERFFNSRRDANVEELYAEYPNFGKFECLPEEPYVPPAARSRSPALERIAVRRRSRGGFFKFRRPPTSEQPRGPAFLRSYDAVLDDMTSTFRIMWSMAYNIWDSEECDHRRHPSALYQAFREKLLGGYEADGRPKLAPPASADSGEAVGCFIIRNIGKQSGGIRQITNNDAIIDMMQRVLPEVRLVFPDMRWGQRKVFEHMYNCSVVLGVHGAGMTNIDYVQPSAAVVELAQTAPLWEPKCTERFWPVCPWTVPPQYYPNMASARGTELIQVGDPAVDKDVMNYTVPDHVLAETEVALRRAFEIHQRRKAELAAT